jgi:hypothetical protein
VANDAKKHHYVSRFYVRRFACANYEKNVMAPERRASLAVH